MISGLQESAGLPAVQLSEDGKKYLEQLRKKILRDRVPTLKATMELVLRFIKLEEDKFIEMAEKLSKA